MKTRCGGTFAIVRMQRLFGLRHLMKATIILALTVATAGCAGVPLAPPDALFVATVEAETLTPRRHPPLCETFSHAASPSQPNDANDVCITNACGWSEARLRVTEPIVGSAAAKVRLRSEVGEWCRPVFFGQPYDLLLVATGPVDSTIEGPTSEQYPLFNVGDELAFMPPFSSLLARWSSAPLEALLKPVPPRHRQSKNEFTAAALHHLLELPYVCDEGNSVAYCKAVFLRDFKDAIRARR